MSPVSYAGRFKERLAPRNKSEKIFLPLLSPPQYEEIQMEKEYAHLLLFLTNHYFQSFILLLAYLYAWNFVFLLLIIEVFPWLHVSVLLLLLHSLQ